MDDREIIDLFLRRDDRALTEAKDKYNLYCFKIAKNILSVTEDAEECVNDAWVKAWNRIPPVVPVSLKAFLGKLVRDISLSRYRENRAKKRYSSMEVMLDELCECVPSGYDLQESIEQHELSKHINSWLDLLNREDRVLFVKRYYFGESVKSIAKLTGCTENQMAQKMLKLRKSLKTFLAEKEVYL